MFLLPLACGLGCLPPQGRVGPLLVDRIWEERTLLKRFGLHSLFPCELTDSASLFFVFNMVLRVLLRDHPHIYPIHITTHSTLNVKDKSGDRSQWYARLSASGPRAITRYTRVYCSPYASFNVASALSCTASADSRAASEAAKMASDGARESAEVNSKHTHANYSVASWHSVGVSLM